MARDDGRSIHDEPAAPRRTPAPGAAEELYDDARVLDLDDEDESPFRRAQKRVPVRRGALPRKAASRLKYAAVGLVIVGALFGTGAALYAYGSGSWRFRIDSSDNIEIAGTDKVSKAQVMNIMGGDIGRNIFFVPLEERKQQLEEIAWVESATVMRLLPDRLQVEIRERVPVAFVQVGSRIALIDAHGVVMELPARSRAQYSFPVISGVGDPEPLSTRAARMKIYLQLIRELDTDGANDSKALSEVDLSDPEDVKVIVADPAGAVLVHLGPSGFLERFKIYQAHVQQWRAQFRKLESVDLRYENQVVVNPDLRSFQPSKAALPAAQPAKKKP